MTRSIPVEKGFDDAMIAYGQNGEAIRPEQGYPLRLIVPGWQGIYNVKWLRRISPAAAASLEEGLEETLTVVRLGVPELLRKTLATTNPIESAFSVAESVTRRVKRWRDGDMRERWCVAGLLDAERRFNRVKGHKYLPQLLAALDRLVASPTLDVKRKQA